MGSLMQQQYKEDVIEMGQAVTDMEQSQNMNNGIIGERINLKNILNFVSYLINALFTYGVGVNGWFGLPTNLDLSEKYQTIVTPKGTAFSIWSIIFMFQAIFAVCQLFPRYRSKSMVQHGVNYWYIAVCVMQVAWTFSFGLEMIPLSLVFMILLWLCLMGLIISQYYTASEQTLEEYWLLRFPFAVHGGWITAAVAVNINTVAVYSSAAASIQLAVGIVSLAALHAISVWVLFGFRKPNYTIACVLAWANGWIYSELQTPKELILKTFDGQVISGVAYASISVACIILVQILVSLAVKGVHLFIATRVSEREDEQNTIVDDAAEEE